MRSGGGAGDEARGGPGGAGGVGALGVVFGDIGTSPLYTVQTVFSPADPHPVRVSQQNVFGITSLIVWSVLIIVTVTYVLLW
jgi:KUP system potassium uptake protein